MSLLLDLIFPRFCYSCHRPGRYLCLDCQSKLVVRSVKKNQRISLFRYHGAIKNMINDLKFEYVSDLVPELSLLISRTLKSKFPHVLDYWQEEKYCLVPIPLHPYRFNWRGFNQSELLAQALSPLLNLPVKNILIRSKNTLPQTSTKNKFLRRANVTNAFELNNQSPSCQRGVRGDLNIVILDDVYTTGSTIKSAISCLPKNTQIWILTIA